MRQRSADGGACRKRNKSLSGVGIPYILQRRKTLPSPSRLPKSLSWLGAVSGGSGCPHTLPDRQTAVARSL